MDDIGRLHDICWIARRMNNRQVGMRLEEFAASLSEQVKPVKEVKT